MLERDVVWVLVQLGGVDAEAMVARRRQAYAALDPLVRGSIRARVQKAVAHAALATREANDDAHVHRLAALELVRAPVLDVDDVPAVAAQFSAISGQFPGPRWRRPRASLALTSALVGIAAAVALPVALRPAPDAYLGVPSARAYVDGGRPLPGTPAMHALFAETLPDYTVALDTLRVALGTPAEPAARAAERAAAERLNTAARAALGPDTASFVAATVDQSRATVEGHGLRAAEAHVRTVDALDRALAERGLGYYVDADVRAVDGRGRVLLTTYAVERATPYRDGTSASINALRLRRIDRLSVAHGMLGFTRRGARDGLVLVARVESLLSRFVLPALAEGASMPLADDAAQSAHPDWEREVSARAGADVRAELAAALGPSADAARLGHVFARRHALFTGWRAALIEHGFVVKEPEGYDADLARFVRLESMVAPSEWRELGELQSELDTVSMRAALHRLEEPLLVSLEVHEIQHCLDFRSGAPLEAMPAALEARTGPLRFVDPRDGETRIRAPAERALSELRAYLSQLARADALPRTALALLATHLFASDAWGTPESYAALVIFEALGDALGVTHGPLVVRGGIDRVEAARIYLAASGAGGARLREAAHQAWQTLFGAPLAELRAAR